MINNALIKSLEKSIFLSKVTRFQRLTRLPIKLTYSKVLNLAALLLKNPIKIKAKTFWDDQLLVGIPETVSLSIYRYGFFEEGLTRMILEYLKPGMTFFDIGAHLGYFTLLGSFLVGNKGSVHSFEPTPATFKVLQSNVGQKGNIYANNVAVLSKRLTVSFNDYGFKYSAFNSIYDTRLSKNLLRKLNPTSYEIEAISIDEYIYNKDIIPGFIKLDAEGAEYEILCGMENTLNKFRPIISIEVGDKDVEGVLNSKDIIQYLIGKGYQPIEYKEDKMYKHKLMNRYAYDNILFLPK